MTQTLGLRGYVRVSVPTGGYLTVAAIGAAAESQQRDLKIKKYCQQIINLHTCTFHTPSGGKPVICYKDVVGTCYSLTDQDLLYWAMLVVSLHIISISCTGY